MLTFILKWILIQFCPKKSRSKNNKWHPQSVNTGFHIILRQVFRLAIKTITGKHFSCNMGQSWQFRRITLSKQKSVWGHCEDCCKPPIFFKKPFSDNSITIFQNYLYLNGHYVFLRLCTDGPYKWSRQLLHMLSLILFSFDVNIFLFLLFLGMVKTLMKLKQKKNKTYLR